MPGLNKELWVPGIIENPIPDTSFVSASVDMSEYVEANKIHLAEAGIEPEVFENYFEGNEDPLPFQKITDIPNEVVLKTYSSAQTRHRDLQDVELQYKKKDSIIGRHRTSLGKNIGKRAAHAWTTGVSDDFNKLLKLGDGDSVIDAIVDLEAFFSSLDKTENLNLCLSPELKARIRKEDKVLYKNMMMADKGDVFLGFKIWHYSQNPLFTAAGTKKPFGAEKEAGDKRCSFAWASDEVFRCFGDTEMYENLRDSGLQADTLSFAQRALVGKIRANSPKYLGTIV
ncbi:hypothetical protein [Tenacibaculum salmonis]|uniref:hypothetical protein n=1 Tax=Tenacibaculum sp. P3-BQ1 TaxID=3232310 RepID=UPI0034DF710C